MLRQTHAFYCVESSDNSAVKVLAVVALVWLVKAVVPGDSGPHTAAIHVQQFLVEMSFMTQGKLWTFKSETFLPAMI